MPSRAVPQAYRVELASNHLALTPFTDNQPLFKFLAAEFADGLVSSGRLRIGTLVSFRQIEQHGPARGDDLEGSNSALAIIDDAVIAPRSTLPPFLAKSLSVQADGPPIRIQNMIIEEVVEDEDHYVFSLAAVSDPRLFHAFRCDTCVRILKPRSFFAALTDAISDRLPSSREPVASMKRVNYGSRHGQYNSAFELQGAFVKPLRYSYQHEVRMLWSAASYPIEPFIAVVPALRQYCEVVAKTETRSPGV